MTKLATSLLITPSLINSLNYAKNKEDYTDFINSLNRLETPTNQYIENGINFEKEVCEGKDEVFSKIVQGGVFQLSAKKIVSVDKQDYLIYGRLDVLKAGIIYDIKRVVRYETQKYLNNAQTAFYFRLIPTAKEFKYLIKSDDGKYHIESYFRDECPSVEELIQNFIYDIKMLGLYDVYLEKWRSK